MEASLQSGYYHRIKVLHEGQAVLGLCLGDYRHRYRLPRPVVHPLYTPAGFPVTEMGAHNFPNIRGIWVAHAELNGVNFFHEFDEAGWIVPVDWEVFEFSESSGQLKVAMNLEWRDPRGSVIAVEQRHYLVSQQGNGNVLDVLSVLRPARETLRIEPDMHGFMGLRVIDAIDEDDGGRMLSSEGGSGEAEISWEKSDQAVNWVDYAGSMGGHPVGVAAMVHPSISPAPMYARGYGVVFLCPQSEKVIEVAAGDAFRFGARFYAYDGTSEPADLTKLWQEFGDISLDI